MTEIFEKLVAANIQLLADTSFTKHFVFERDGCVALVERRDHGFGGIGAPGIMTARGLAVLVWKGPEAHFVARGFDCLATQEQVEALRSFAADLQAALGRKEN